MPRTKTISAVVALIAVVLAAAVSAQEPTTQGRASPAVADAPASKRAVEDIASLEEQSRKVYENKEYVSWYGANIKLLNQRPYEPGYMLNVIAACALLNRLNTAYHYMLRMQQQGLSYDLNQNPDTMNMRNTEVYDYLNDLMVQAGEPGGIAEAVFQLDNDHAGPAAITWDKSRGRFLLGTQSGGAIIAMSEEGDSEVLIQANIDNGLWAIKDLYADAANNRLWVSSAAVPGFSTFQPENRGKGALFEFNLETLELINQFNVPVDGSLHEPGPIAVSDAGDVYMVDQATALVYRKAADTDRLERFVGFPEMNALQAIAITPDNSRLYVADLYRGVVVVDPQENTFVELSVPETMNMGRIQSLTYDRGHLVITQSGLEPERVMRLKLDAGGGQIVDVKPIAKGMKEFNQPGLATLKGEHVYYLVQTGDKDGNGANRSMTLLRSPLVNEMDVPTPKKIQDAMERIVEPG